MSEANLQDRNVGNLGDILKHAALLQLAKIFAEQVTEKKYYLDSHSYLYQSQLANPAWQEQTQALLSQSALYQDYLQTQSPYIVRSEYLCSSGLVNSILPEAHLLLSEVNRTTRDCLLQQLVENKVDAYTLKEQILHWPGDLPVKRLPNLLALIDPFELTEELWQSVGFTLSKILSNNASAIMLVFDYTHQADKAWPLAPKGWVGPLASISPLPYKLAVYSSAGFVRPVQRQLAKMGWCSSGR